MTDAELVSHDDLDEDEAIDPSPSLRFMCCGRPSGARNAARPCTSILSAAPPSMMRAAATRSSAFIS
jgi:hypothetical protein